MELLMDIGQHLPALGFVEGSLEGWHGRFHGPERFDHAALGDAPVEVTVTFTGCGMKVVGQIRWLVF